MALDLAWAAEVLRAAGATPSGEPSRVGRGDAAEVVVWGDGVLKLHAACTDRVRLAQRLALARSHELFVPPLADHLIDTPGGRVASLWPRVEVVDPDASDVPWDAAGRLLAGLHVSAVPGGAPRTTWAERLHRARGGAQADLRALADSLIAVASVEAEQCLVHGDWHLGQLGRWHGEWRLLDIDDVGVGGPAWDLARPAGFWACGLLADEDWHALLRAYRDAGGPAVPPAGDPWPVLDLPARAAVFVAAVRASGRDDAHSRYTARTLLDACRRMAQ